MPDSRPNISFEFFPPRSLEASFHLWQAVETLAPYDPAFVSVTYGAGGATRNLTREALGALIAQYGLNVAGHLTCVGAGRAETLAVAEGYAADGVREVVALRGDPPNGSGAFTPHPKGFSGSLELIAALRDSGKFTIRVAAYPEPHPEAADAQADVAHLKRKFDAGADSAITQFFFDVESFLRFRDRCAAAGITKKIIPGILPVENWRNLRRFAARCGASLPGWMDDAFGKAARDGREDLLAIAIASELCADLIEEGVGDLHFYTLNRPELVRRTLGALGIEPHAGLQKVA